MKTLSLDEARRQALALGASLEVDGKVFNAGQRRISRSTQLPQLAAPDGAVVLAEVIKLQTAMLERLFGGGPAPEPEPQPESDRAHRSEPDLEVPQGDARVEEPQVTTSLASRAARNAPARAPRARHAYEMSIEREGRNVDEVRITRDGAPAFVVTPDVDPDTGRIETLYIEVQGSEDGYIAKPLTDPKTGLISALSITPVGRDSAAHQ